MSEAKKVRVSTSFSEDEVFALEELFAVLRRGGDPKIVLRQSAAQLAQRKIVALSDSIRSKKVEP